MTALHLAPEPVVLLSKAPLGAEASSLWAQGGLAAAMGDDDDPALHVADTIAAGAGLCDGEIASRIVHAAPAAVEHLARLGVGFDRRPDGGWRLGLEAAHNRNRIVHATGDGTGREIMRALIAAVRACPSITLLEGTEARRLIVEDNAITGVLAAGERGALLIETGRVVIATGGIGGLFLDSTNPAGCFGQGLALAAHAGAKLSDLEFVQFHPTAFDGPSRPMPLLTEAIRGDGAILIDETGERFMADQPGAELAPRDIVARAVWRRRAQGHRVFLDARKHPGKDFAQRYPVISAFCRMAGIDPATDPIPVRPAAHYHMGGIAVDSEGRSTVSGLWACGEVEPYRAAWREPARQQFADGSRGLRAMGRGERQGRNRRPCASARDPAAAARIRSVDRASDGVARPRRAARPGRDRPHDWKPLSDRDELRCGLRSGAGRIDDRRFGLPARGKPWRPLPDRFPGQPAFGRAFVDLSAGCTNRGARDHGNQNRAGQERTMLTLNPLLPIMYEPLVRTALLEDLGRAGDITADAIVPADQRSALVLRARQPGVVAGLDIARCAFQTISPAITLRAERPDGSTVAPGDIIAEIDGPARGLLTGERTALNFLCHLSGVATATASLVSAVKGTRAQIVCTRKTTPGLRALEKYAVRAGGGGNHRFGLDDAVLIKDNHIALAGGIRTAVERAKTLAGHLVKIEVEVDTLAQLEQALSLGVDAVLLDNMTVDDLKEAVAMASGKVITEASGRITAATAPAIAATGVDLISVGWVTHSAAALDIGLDYLELDVRAARGKVA